MKEFNSCKDAIDSCIDKKSFAIAHLYKDEKPMDMHIHDSYEIYYSISGGKQFLIDNRFYDIQPGDIFFINQYESHHLTQIDSQIHERIVLSIYPEYLKNLCTKATDLNYCFSHRDRGCHHKISLPPEDQKRFRYYIHKLCSIQGYVEDLLEQSGFVEMMVFLNRIFCESCHERQFNEGSNYHKEVDQILSYINQNIKNPLTIEELSSHFYLSSSYLCRIFKQATGTTINKYITAKRITIAKALLTEGSTVNEACEESGFNDYSNFLKAFSRAVGVSPKKYSSFST